MKALDEYDFSDWDIGWPSPEEVRELIRQRAEAKRIRKPKPKKRKPRGY